MYSSSLRYSLHRSFLGRDRSQSVSTELNTSQKSKLSNSKKYMSVGDNMSSLDYFPSKEGDESKKNLSMIERLLDGVKPSTVVGTFTEVGSIMVSLSIAIVESKEPPKEATPIGTRRSMFNNSAMANAMATAAAAATGAASSSAAASWGATTASHVSASSHGHGLVPGAAPKELICKVIPIDSAFTTSMVVPVNLPTIAMIDKVHNPTTDKQRNKQDLNSVILPCFYCDQPTLKHSHPQIYPNSSTHPL